MNRVPKFFPNRYIAALVLIAAGAQVFCLPSFGETITAMAAPSAVNAPDIAGRWESSYGPVDLKVVGSSGGQLKLSGSWRQGADIGTITTGTFDGQKMVFDYYQPWNLKYGRCTLQKIQDVPEFQGSYEQPAGSGSGGGWNLARPPRTDSGPVGNVQLPAGMVDISGNWESDFGKVTLTVTGVTADGMVKVRGAWKQSDGIGAIPSGTFDGKTLTLLTYQPWNLKYLKVIFSLDDTGKQASGTYRYLDGGSSGVWNIVRPPNFIATEAPSGDPAPWLTPQVEESANQATITFSSDILFDYDKSDIRKDSIATLARIQQEQAARFPGKHVSVQGHSDNTGSAIYNVDLSCRRAISVAKFLSEHGVDAKLVEVRGFGESCPKVPNDSDPNRARNRRVEIVITGG